MKTEYAEIYEIELLSRKTFSPRDAFEIQTLLKELSPKRRLPKDHEIGLILPGVSVWVARVRETRQIVSMATLATSPNSLWLTRIAQIWDVVTLKDHQRRGLAESILRAMISSNQSAGLLYLELFSRPERIAAHRLYEKLGFIRVAEATKGEKNGRHCYRFYFPES